ncbi:MAG: DUF3575 domain-containing protein [Bacteroidota bacterium]
MNPGIRIFILFSIFYMPLVLFPQGKDSTAAARLPQYKNTIKFNPTPMILWNLSNITFSYERVLTPGQSISVELGYLVFPKLVEDTLVNLIDITTHSKWGINATVEYRFYLTKLNTRPVPAGIYIGPYLTYYGYHFRNNFDILHAAGDSAGTIKGDYWSFNLGAELGYQFVFWKHWTLDLVLIGPSISYYGGKTEISGNLNPEQIQEINEALYEKLKDRFPMATGAVGVDKTFKQTGKLDVFRMGFRYLVQIGFHF